MAIGNKLKCTNCFGYPHSTVKQSKNYVRLALKSKDEAQVREILEQMTGLLDKKLLNYRWYSSFFSGNLISTEISNFKKLASNNFDELQKCLKYPLSPECDPNLYPHYLLEVKRLDTLDDNSHKFDFNIKHAVEFRKSFFEKHRSQLVDPRLKNAKSFLESLDSTGHKIEKIMQNINLVANYAKQKNYTCSVPLSIEQKFLNTLKPQSHC